VADPGLIAVSLLSGRRVMKAAVLPGRSPARRQKAHLGFVRGTTPRHATLTETLRVIDARALADVLGALDLEDNGKARHIAIVLRLRSATISAGRIRLFFRSMVFVWQERYLRR
jgi:hypothetical protein